MKNVFNYPFVLSSAHDEANLSISYFDMSEDGIPLHITQWKINSDKLSSKSLFPYKVENGHSYDIVDRMKKYVLRLINLPPCENVVSFYSVICFQDGTTLTVSLARNTVDGLPVKSYSNVTNWTVSRVRQIANALIVTLAYVKKNKLSHGNIKNSTVFIDGINKYLNYLASETKYFLSPTVKSDINDTANLIGSIELSSC